jgi:hypothetical protein
MQEILKDSLIHSVKSVQVKKSVLVHNIFLVTSTDFIPLVEYLGIFTPDNIRAVPSEIQGNIYYISAINQKKV